MSLSILILRFWRSSGSTYRRSWRGLSILILRFDALFAEQREISLPPLSILILRFGEKVAEVSTIKYGDTFNPHLEIPQAKERVVSEVLDEGFQSSS